MRSPVKTCVENWAKYGDEFTALASTRLAKGLESWVDPHTTQAVLVTA